MTNILLALTFIIACLDWLAVARGWKKIEYIAKPATMLFLFAWLVFTGGLHGALLWFGLGVLFSLSGDVFLMFSDRWFIPGLLAFLLAHVMYIIGLNQPTLPDVPLFWSIGIAIAVALGAARILQRIEAGLAAKGLQKLIRPVNVYGIAISLMLLSALLTLFRKDWQSLASFPVAAGAVLFFFSDVILAWNKFVNPIRNGRLMNLVAYHLGQIALIVGAVYQFK